MKSSMSSTKISDWRRSTTRTKLCDSPPMPRFRFTVISALWMTLFFLFLDRVNISLAVPYMMDELKLTGVETGIVLSAYYWGYIAGQLGGGFASDHWTIRRWATSCFSAGASSQP